MSYQYKVMCPHYKAKYFTSFMGAYQRVIDMLHDDDEVSEATQDYGYCDGVGIWERTAEGGWRYDHPNTAEAWREVYQS